MTTTKTRKTDVSVDAFIDQVRPAKRQADARVLVDVMAEVTGEPPAMWGPTIVGFGRHHYVYPSGREGDTPCVGFSPRKAHLVLYGLASAPDVAGLVERLGKHRAGAACLYVNKLEDVDLDAVRELTRRGYAHMASTSVGFLAKRAAN
jgi:hypothetical protein